MQALMIFWPKKEKTFYDETNEARIWRLSQEKNALLSRHRRFLFEFMRIQGQNTISILDLIKMSVNFQNDCAFGKEVHHLLDKYNEFNIKPRYVFHKTEYTFQNYVKYVPYSCLIEDFIQAFVKRFGDDWKIEDEYLFKQKEDKEQSFDLPPSDWVLKSVLDETDKNQEYFDQLEERKSKIGVHEIWDIAKILNQD